MTPHVNRINKRLRLGRPILSHGVDIVHTRVRDQDVRFCVNMENDPIQRNHRKGRFYEMKELSEISEIFPKKGTFVDIGANVGNHSLFAALFFGAGRLVPFEPNQRAYELLIANIQVNGLAGITDLTKLGVGIGKTHDTGFAMEDRERNLGGAKMLAGEGEIEVFSGDELLEGEVPAMIKIDVEGMELEALAGLENTVGTHKPMLLVEVDNENEDAFLTWADTQNYIVLKTYQRYRLNKNHLIVPKSKASEYKKFAGKKKQNERGV